MDRGQMTLMGAGFCSMLTMHFTIQLLSQHMLYWKNPKQQTSIIIILLLPTIYSLNSFVSLLHLRGTSAFFFFFNSLKECFEALAIAKFMELIYSYLNVSIGKNVVPDEMKGRETRQSFPMTLFQPRTIRLDEPTLKLLKYSTWQFVVIRPICSILMMILQILGIYPSWMSWMFTIILNLSIYTALYSLVLFYNVFAKELKPHKPLAKFMCITGIVFFVFWQGMLLETLVAGGIVKSHHFWLDVKHLQAAIQNVLICVEMVFLSVLQQYAYHISPYSGDIEIKVQQKKNE